LNPRAKTAADDVATGFIELGCHLDHKLAR
jgi:hypothetical protein